MGNSCCSSLCHYENVNASDICLSLSDITGISRIDELISYIEDRLNTIEDNSTAQIPENVEGGIKFGKDLLEKVLKRVYREPCKMCCTYNPTSATRKVVIDVLREIGKIHWLVAGACVVGYIADQIEQISSNKAESIQLLKYMCGLAKHVKELNDSLPDREDKLNDVLHFIVEGSLMCLSQMQSHNLHRFFYASVNAEDLRSFHARIANKYQDLTLEAMTDLLNRTSRALPPSQGVYPDAVGIEEARDEVIRLLQMDVIPSRTAVVVYGVGGIGKTTLATAVFNKLDLTSYKFCRLDMPDSCSEDHLKGLQTQILSELFNEHLMLTSYVDGQSRLREYFKRASEPVFMLINNAIKGSDLEKLLPRDLSSLPKQTKILLTSRRLDETSMLLQRGIIERKEYCVRFLSPAQSKKFLCKTALGSEDLSFPPGLDIDGLVEKCSGIPLILHLIGSKLREYLENEAICKELVTTLMESLTKGEGEMCEAVVDVVYDSLKEPSVKEAFLDIVFFFNNFPCRTVSYVVGRDNLKALEHAGLVQVTRDDYLKQNNGDPQKWTNLANYVKDMDYQTGTVKVVDAVRARGKQLSNSDRVMDDLSCLHKTIIYGEKIKGIWVSNNIEHHIGWQNFAPTSSSLRILHLEHKVFIHGVCKDNFENLRYLRGYALPVDVNNVKRLAFLVGNVPYDVYELPSSLRLLQLFGKSRLPAGLLESLGKLSSVEELTLDYHSSRLATLPATFSMLQSLRFLDLSLNLNTLPDSFGNLSALEGLSLKHCPELFRLPESFCELKSLRFLNIENGKFTELPEKFGDLSALEELHLSCDLVNLPISFGMLMSLRTFTLNHCRKLISLPESFGNLPVLEELHLTYCTQLTALPQGFPDLASLQELRLNNVSKLDTIPENFGQLTSLKSLYIIRSYSLTTLPDGFGSLSSLEDLRLEECPELEKLPQSFGQLCRLKELYISGPKNMVTLPDQFGRLKSLERLSLICFESLQKLCLDFQCLISLVALALKECSQVEEKTMDTLVEMNNLATLDIDGSPALIERSKQMKDHLPFMVLYKHQPRKVPPKRDEKMDKQPEKREERKQEPKKEEKKDGKKSAHGEEQNGRPQFPNICYYYGIKEDPVLFEYDYGRFTETISTLLSFDKSSFLHVDIGGKLAQCSPSFFLSSDAKLAMLITKCDLSSSSNREALQIVKNKSAELASQDFHVMYVQVGESREKSEQIITKSLPFLLPGTCAWIAPDDKTRQIFALAAYKLMRRTSVSRGWKPWHATHTLIAGIRVSAGDGGAKMEIGDWEILLPQDEEGDDFEAMRDAEGGFLQLFNSIERSLRYLA